MLFSATLGALCPTQVRQTPAERRKLVAVVYADMVGYSRLIGLDDQGTLDRLRALRRDVIDPARAEHGGNVVQNGEDSLLIIFDSTIAIPLFASGHADRRVFDDGL